MADKPSYEALEKRVAALEAQSRRSAELRDELEQSLNFTESLLAAIPTPVFWKDSKGRYQGCNAAFAEIMGVTSEQIQGKTVQDLWPGGQAAVYHQKDLELLENPLRQVYEFEVKDKQGRIRPVVYHKNVFRNGSGRIAGIVGGFTDISDIRKAQLEHQALFSMSLDMICIADIHTATFLKVNPAFTATLGYSEKELLSVPFTHFIHPEDIEPTRKVMEERLKEGEKVINFKNRYRCRNGEYRYLNWVSHPVPEEGVTYAVAHDVTQEIHAYEALRCQRNLLNSLFDHLPMGITIWGDDGRLLMINRGFSRITGYSMADIADLNDWFLRAYPDPDYRRAVMEDWAGARNSMHASREFKVACRDGGVKAIEFQGAFLKDGRALVTLSDVTEIRKVREEIRQRRQFLESVLYHAPDAIVTLDERHRVIDWNPGAVKMFGYTPEEAIGIQLDDLVAPHQHHAEAGRKTAQVLSGRRVEAFETVRYRKDGSPIHVIAAGSPIMVEGVLKGVVAVYTDITDRVRNEEVLRTSHKRFITVLNSIDATIYVADMKTHEILFMSQKMIETFGGDLTGKICWETFRKESAPCPHCTNDRLVDENGQPTGVVAWQGPNPISGRWYINHDRAIEWIDGRIVRLQIATDITDYKRMEDALQRAQRMEAIGTMAGGIAHDFNNLLMGIQGHASLIAIDLPPDHPHAKHAAAIEEHIRSAANLTQQLLGLARGGKYEVAPVDVNALVETSAAMFGRTRKQIRIRTRTAQESMVIAADKRQIEQVLLNIYINAWQAMPDGGDLYLETSPAELDADTCIAHQIPPGQYIKISLTDTGVGMSEDVRQKVFDPFFTTKEKGRGIGLGLASAYGIIRNHGGVITVYSEAGHGSTFNIYLPRCRKSAAPDMQTGGESVGGTETILVVDDETMITDVAGALLKKLGYRVIAVNDGESAVEAMKRMGTKIDLVLLDMIMPGIDGGKTFYKIREVRPSVPVILSSGYSINGQAAKILQSGCNGFIQKPFNISELAKKIREVLK
ncbi:PAS domain S-box protein [Desulfococcus sp.]|uniref:PAS domain S-box protein n=1 Tax=Desulfococcus sp. TaxID=2025834 RepID=UPI003593005E